MIFKSEHMTQASGSIAGVTYARAKGGTLYRRSRAIPVNPQTTYQSQVRTALTNLVNRWINVLTPTQRTAWDTYAQNVTVTNALGSPTHISGQNWYIACNTPRQQCVEKYASAIQLIDDAPTTYDRGDFTTPDTLTADVVTGVEFNYNDTDAWALEAESALLVYMGRPRNPSRKFFKGPYRLLFALIGDPLGLSPPQNIAAATVAATGFPLVAGQMIDFEFSVTRADGRLSTRRKIGSIIVTP